MAGEGRGIVFITHKLDEVMSRRRPGDRPPARAPRRDGRERQTSEAELARLMIGRDSPARPSPRSASRAPRVLRLEGSRRDDERGLPALSRDRPRGARGRDPRYRRRRRERAARARRGGRRPPRASGAGRVVFAGRTSRAGAIRRRIEAGIGYCPEDRLRFGVAPALSIQDNLIAKSYRKALRSAAASCSTWEARAGTPEELA